MTIKDEQTLCPSCERPLAPRIMTAPGEPKLSCGHPVTLWVWPCRCGEVISQRVKRCPHCVGLRAEDG